MIGAAYEAVIHQKMSQGQLTMFRRIKTSSCQSQCTIVFVALSAKFLASQQGAKHSSADQSSADR